MNTLRWAVSSIRKRGLVQTSKIAGNVVSDFFFDWKYGTDTTRWIERDELGAQSDNLRHSSPYRATKIRPFLKLLDELAPPRDSNFVDIGSGKGRVLLIASQYGFRKVIGIEFSEQLCVLARRNVELYSRKTKLRSPIEVIEADATKHHFQAEDRVFFMFNPFGSSILSQVLHNIRLSLEEFPRKAWLIYNDPEHHDVVKGAGLFKSDSFFEIGGNHFAVYAN